MTTFAYQPPVNERLLWGCVAASLLLHAMLMWRMHGVEPAAPMVQEFKATIRTQTPPAPRPAAEPPKPEVVIPEPPKPEPPKPPEPVPLPKPVLPPTAPTIAPKTPPVERKATPVAPATPQPATPAPVTPTPAAPTDTKSDAKADAAKAPAAAPSAGSAPAASGEMKALIQSYELELAQAAQKYKLYPNEAMSQGWEGTAQIKVHIGADGRIAGIDLVSSTGHDMLDEQAKKTAQKAKPFVQIPPQLKGQPFDAEIRVVFTLKQP
jgi:protein TonB